MRKLKTYICDTCAGKILEKLIFDQIYSYINDNKIICKQQSGFRSGHSTETALLYCTNQWLLNMDKGLINGVLFLDFKMSETMLKLLYF